VRVLGLDPSLTNFGWALHDPGAEGLSRCLRRGRFRTKPKDFPDVISRYIHLRESLDALIEELQPDMMGIEHPVFNDTFSEGMYGLFLFSLESIRRHRQDVVFFSPGQIKSLARLLIDRPKGWKMMKQDMVEAARTDTGGKGAWDHNEADAYLVARASARFWGLQNGSLQTSELNSEELRMFTDIHVYTRGKKAGQTVTNGILHRESERFFLWSKI